MRNCSWYFLLIVSFMISCAQKQPSADAIIAKSIEAHGGMENYQQLKHLDLLKDIKRYDSTEALTLHRIERQHFSFVAPRQSSIQFKEGEDTILYEEKEKVVIRKYNDSLVHDTQKLSAAKSALDGARFVLFQPFLLEDGMASKAYAGMSALEGDVVHVVAIKFANSEDEWEFYFAESNYLLRGYRVYHNQRYSLIINETTQAHEGLILVKDRSSYFTDSSGRSRILTARYAYQMLPSD